MDLFFFTCYLPFQALILRGAILRNQIVVKVRNILSNSQYM